MIGGDAARPQRLAARTTRERGSAFAAARASRRATDAGRSRCAGRQAPSCARPTEAAARRRLATSPPRRLWRRGWRAAAGWRYSSPTRPPSTPRPHSQSCGTCRVLESCGIASHAGTPAAAAQSRCCYRCCPSKRSCSLHGRTPGGVTAPGRGPPRCRQAPRHQRQHAGLDGG